MYIILLPENSVLSPWFMKINSAICCQLLCIIFHIILVFICMTYPVSRDFPPPLTKSLCTLRILMWNKFNFLLWIRPFFCSFHSQENLSLAFSRRLGKHYSIWLTAWLEIGISCRIPWYACFYSSSLQNEFTKGMVESS